MASFSFPYLRLHRLLLRHFAVGVSTLAGSDSVLSCPLPYSRRMLTGLLPGRATAAAAAVAAAADNHDDGAAHVLKVESMGMGMGMCGGGQRSLGQQPSDSQTGARYSCYSCPSPSPARTRCARVGAARMGSQHQQSTGSAQEGVHLQHLDIPPYALDLDLDLVPALVPALQWHRQRWQG